MAEKLITVVNALIPGDGAFPKASDVGVHGVLAWRIRELQGAQGYGQLLQAIGDSSGEAAATQLERDHPDLFTTVRMIVYLAYYEQPEVIQVIRESGFIYNDSPQPLGYELEPFDPSVDRPDVQGSYLSTNTFDQKPENAS